MTKLLGTSSNNAINISIKEKYGTIVYEGSHNGEVGGEEFHLSAAGKTGASGTPGRDGLDGASGSNGYRATRVTFGTSGGNGGNGTDGTPGENGKDGGPGGSIQVAVDIKDLDLLDSITGFDVSGGEGGKFGRHGLGGRGGAGGLGGPALHWQEQEIYTSVAVVHHHDFGHHGHYGHCHNHLVPVNNYRFVKKFHPGGPSGQRGNDGITPTQPLVNGAPGAPGSVNIMIKKGDTLLSTHSQTYKLSVDSMNFGTQSVFEYGQTVHWTAQVRNSAPTMHSPQTELPIIISENNFILPELPAQIAEDGIEPNQVKVSTEGRFKIKHPTTSVSHEPYSTAISVDSAVWNVRLKRPYQHASRQDRLTAGYPIQLRPISTNRVVAAGESLSFEAIVERNPAFIGGDGRTFLISINNQKSSPFVYENSWMQSNYTQQVRFNSPPNSPLANETVLVNLFWELIDQPNSQRQIQKRFVTVQITPRYVPKGSGYLLVINAETPREIFDSWYTRLRKLANNQDIDIWNTSYYGYFDLDNKEHNLLHNTKHGTVVILDNKYEKDKKNSHLITPEQLRQASQDCDISVIVEGEVNQLGGGHFNTPNAAIVCGSVSELISILLSDVSSNVDASTSRKLMHKLMLPSNKISQQKEYLEQTLKNVFPNRSYFVMADSTGLNVVRLPNQLVTTKKQFSDDDVIDKLPFSQKLRTVFAECNNEYHQQLIHSIIKDLESDRSTLAKSHTYRTLFRTYNHDFTKELTCLRQLVDALKRDNHIAVAFTPLVIQLIAAVQYQAEQHTSFWTWLASFFGPQVDEQLKTSTEALSRQALRALHQSNSLNSEERLNQKVAFRNKLIRFLEQDKSGHASFSFFSRPTASDFKAISELLLACNDGFLSEDRIDSKLLAPFYDEFEALYQADTIRVADMRCYNTH